MHGSLFPLALTWWYWATCMVRYGSDLCAGLLLVERLWEQGLVFRERGVCVCVGEQFSLLVSEPLP